MHSNSRIIKVTGYRLASTALTLCLAISKFSMSAENKSAPSNYLDLAGFLVALMCVLEMPKLKVGIPTLIPFPSFMWIGYYSDAHDTFAPWFFHEDYGPSLGKGLRELGHLCLAGVFALFYFIFNDLDIFPWLSIVREGDREMRYVSEVKATSLPLILCLYLGFFLVEGVLLTWGMCSAVKPRPVYSNETIFLTRLFTSAYMLIMLRMSLLIWRQSDPRSLMHFQMIYER
jgi:hypothetical protein